MTIPPHTRIMDIRYILNEVAAHDSDCDDKHPQDNELMACTKTPPASSPATSKLPTLVSWKNVTEDQHCTLESDIDAVSPYDPFTTKGKLGGHQGLSSPADVNPVSDRPSIDSQETTALNGDTVDHIPGAEEEEAGNGESRQVPLYHAARGTSNIWDLASPTPEAGVATAESAKGDARNPTRSENSPPFSRPSTPPPSTTTTATPPLTPVRPRYTPSTPSRPIPRASPRAPAARGRFRTVKRLAWRDAAPSQIIDRSAAPGQHATGGDGGRAPGAPFRSTVRQATRLDARLGVCPAAERPPSYHRSDNHNHGQRHRGRHTTPGPLALRSSSIISSASPLACRPSGTPPSRPGNGWTPIPRFELCSAKIERSGDRGGDEDNEDGAGGGNDDDDDDEEEEESDIGQIGFIGSWTAFPARTKAKSKAKAKAKSVVWDALIEPLAR